jgi:tetratricopeptide (TPR) repeat protein
MAKTLSKAGKHGAAAKSLESYLASSPLDEEANLMLGMELEEAGHFKSALAVYEFLTEIAPTNPEGLKRAGAMMRHKGEHRKALEFYERALAADPRDRDAIKARKDLAAEAALQSSRLDDVEHSRDARRDEGEARRLERSGRLHFSAEELESELTRLEALRAENPSDPDLMLELAEVHERRRDYDAAWELVDRARQYRKDSLDLLTRAAALKLKALKRGLAKAGKEGRREDADRLEQELADFEVADLDRRLQLSPGDAGLRLELGRALLRRGEFDRAASELQRAMVDPRLAGDALFHLGQCFQRKGYLDLARQEFEKALGMRSGVDERAREILYNLGSIAEAEGDGPQARSFYARIYAVDIGFRDVAAKMESLN